MLHYGASAKLNLTLQILGKHASGYHALETLVVFADLSDRLEAREGKELTLTVRGEFAQAVGDGEDNLVLRAAKALRERTGCTRGAALSLQKNIPVGAGFGGGSADAAAALRLLNDLWQLRISEKELAAIGLTLGADVPMCLAAVPLLARGIGEEITPLASPLPKLHAVLVWPRQKLATRDVFAAFDAQARHCERSEAIQSVPLAHPGLPRRDAPRNDEFFEWLAGTGNDLETPATALMPEIGDVLEALRHGVATPKFVRMSGSGSGCYALLANAADAGALADTVRVQHPNWWVKATEIIPSPARP